MQYILTQEEFNSKVDRTEYAEMQKKFVLLRDQYIKEHGCNRRSYGVCDNCNISSMKIGMKICGEFNEKYSK